MTKRPELELVDAPQPSQRQLDEEARSIRAMAGGELDAFDHEALLALALGEDVAEEEVLGGEREEADALRHALEGGGPHPLAELARALRHAAAPVPLDDVTNQRLVRRALMPRDLESAPRRLWPVVSGLVAVAAGVFVVVGSMRTEPARPSSASGVEAAAPQAKAASVARTSAPGAAGDGASLGGAGALVGPRSTAGLFDPASPFGPHGGESDRAATIVASRAADYRANRFAAWGVR